VARGEAQALCDVVSRRRLDAGPTSAAYTLAQRTAAEMLGSGTFTQLEHSLGFGDINGVFAH
jgi:hypothetical protein